MLALGSGVRLGLGEKESSSVQLGAIRECGWVSEGGEQTEVVVGSEWKAWLEGYGPAEQPPRPGRS